MSCSTPTCPTPIPTPLPSPPPTFSAICLLSQPCLHHNPLFSPQGLEIHWATNFYGHFILTQLLLPNLLASAAAAATYVAGRVVVITSQLHGLVQEAWPDYTYSSLPVYGTLWGWIAYCRWVGGSAGGLQEEDLRQHRPSP
jgi:NAD(P)-dependent dehydrogenase (short-subunit alcohol dehydrogenase family)